MSSIFQIKAWRWGWLALVLALGLWVRWPGMTRSVWEDEVNSFLECRAGFGYTPAELEKMVVTCAETGFWSSFQVFKICDWLKWTGSVAGTRLPLLIVGLICIGLGWALGGLWRNRLLGFALALLLALWPFKILWDTMVRYYAVELCLMMAQIVAAEAFRLRPEGYKEFIVLAVVSMLAALSQPVAAVLLALPWIYLLWSAGQGVARLTRRREGGARSGRREWGARAARLATQAALLAAVTLSAVQYNRGADWIIEQWKGAEQAGKPERARMPALRDVGGYAGRGFKKAFTAGQWSPAPLLGMEARSLVFAALVRGGHDGAGPLPPRAEGWLLIGILAGSLALGWRSPPLLAALWAVALSTGLLLELNQKAHFIASRYYAAPGLGGVILLAAGVSGVLALAWWPVQRWRPRWTLWAEPAAALALGIGLTVALAPQGRRSAKTIFQNWLGFIADTQARHPGGVLYVGIEGKNVGFYQDLAAAREGRHPHPDYWSSPLRHRSYDGYKQPWLQDAALLEKFNAYDAVTFFNYDYWPGEFLPFYTHERVLPPLTRSETVGIKARTLDLGHRVYVTRGHAGILLRPRMREDGTATSESGKRWRMECFFEVPGEYELRIAAPEGVRPVRLNVAGRETPLEKGRGARGEGQAAPSGVLPWGLNEDWRGVPAEALPLPRGVKEVYGARIETPPDLTQALEIELALDRPAPAGTTTALEWRLSGQVWRPLTPHYDVGTLAAWNDARGFGFGVPLRMNQADGRRLMPRFQLVNAAGNAVLGELVFPIEPRRGLRAGEAVFMGPYFLDEPAARRLAGKTLVLTLLPLVRDPVADGRETRDPLLNARGIYRPLTQYCLTYLRFVEKAGKMIAQYAAPEG